MPASFLNKMNKTLPPVAVVGLGLIGTSLAKRLLGAGFVVHGFDVDAARSELLSTLESVAREPITAEELERAKTKWLKGWDLAFTNPETVGISLSESVAQGDWRLFFLTRDRVRDATLADLEFPQKPFRPGQRELAAGVYRACTQSHPLLVQAHALRPDFDLTNTPLVYALGALYPARYASALRWHRGLSVLAFGLAVAALLPLTNGAALGTVVLTVLLAAGYWPFWLNLAVGNLAALQLAGLVVGIGLARRTRSSPTAGLLNVAWLTALVLIKPNIALPCALLWWFSLAHLPRVWRLPAVAVSVACAAVLLTYAARFFASPAIWLDWLWVLFGAPNRLAYDYALGNVSSAHWLAQATGLSV